MYGGILSIDYSRNDSGLLLSFPGRHQLFVIDPYTVEGKITHFAGSEDPDFSFYFILRFEYRIGWFVFLSVQNTTGSNRYFCWKQLAHQLLKDIQISI